MTDNDKLFCARCDAILPLNITGTVIVCRMCALDHSVRDIVGKEITTTVIFNVRHRDEEVAEEENMGPMTDRRCPNCDHEGMTYTTRQLRGADEGQTVFYLCPRCKYQDNENS